jgi:15-cis-phytoene synthase
MPTEPSMPASAPVTVEASFARCVEITKARARNFHFAFAVLPRERYEGICALYAFARLADDISDDERDPQKVLANAAAWRAAFDKALAGNPAAHPILPAVAETFRRYRIPPVYMHELITGTEMDARQQRYEKWDDTYRYCYRVASVIGIMTVHVFGFSGEQDVVAIPLAEKLGIAFQMTNILRDLKEDAGRGRIYLPQEDLRALSVSEEELLAGKVTPALRKLVRAEYERAMAYYVDGRPLLPLIAAESRDALGSLVGIYQRLLEEIKRRDYDVFTRRVSLSTAEKLKVTAGFAWKRLLRKR